MIDIKKAKEEFIKYTENYDLEDSNIKRKQGHSLRVMELSTKIGEELGLNRENIEIATIIGLLHDIARFEQYRQYGFFSDSKSFDHGDYGVSILEKDMRKYVDTDRYDELIKIAIKNHNKFKVQDGLNEEELLFTKIIRDADKTDIFFEATELFFIGKEDKISRSEITDKIYEDFIQCKTIFNKDVKTDLDNVIKLIGLIFDINFDITFKILKENDYINKILNRFNFTDIKTKKQIEEIRKIANEYIDEKSK